MFFGVNFSFNEKHFLYSFILKCLADVEGGCARSNLCSHIIRFEGSLLCVSVLVYSLRLNYSIKSFSHSPPQLSEMRCTLTVCVCEERVHIRVLVCFQPWALTQRSHKTDLYITTVKQTDGDQKQSRNMVHADCVFWITSSVFNTTTVSLFRDTLSNEL